MEYIHSTVLHSITFSIADLSTTHKHMKHIILNITHIIIGLYSKHIKIYIFHEQQVFGSVLHCQLSFEALPGWQRWYFAVQK